MFAELSYAYLISSILGCCLRNVFNIGGSTNAASLTRMTAVSSPCDITALITVTAQAIDSDQIECVGNSFATCLDLSIEFCEFSKVCQLLRNFMSCGHLIPIPV